MSLLARNITANLVGSGWSAGVTLAVVPLYIRLMGIEAYGLIGFMTTLLSLGGVLDVGLSATLSREMARLSNTEVDGRTKRELLRTLEVPYWLMASLLGSVIVAAAPFLATNWIGQGALGSDTVRLAISLMGAIVAIQWPIALYSGGLQGLQRQELLNAINVVMITARGLGGVLVLWAVSPTLEALLLWNLVVSPVHTAILAYSLWRGLPKGCRATFRPRLLKDLWGFTAGMGGISTLAVILTQADKVVLSRVLSLEEFGYYSLATAAASGLYRLIVPVFSAFYPRFTQLAAHTDTRALSSLYHRGCQFLSLLLLPVTAVVVFLPKHALLVWTGDEQTADRAATVLAALLVGTALNGLMNLPYALQLAHGWTRLTLTMNAIAVVVLVPAVFALASRYGAIGGASGWVALNSGYVFVGILFMHRRLLPGEQRQWYIVDVGLPLSASLAMALLGRILASGKALTRLEALGVIIVLVMATQAAASLATPLTREWLLKRWRAPKQES